MGRMILNGTVYGAGSKVEANPDETATDELKKIDIDGTIYNISKSYLIRNAFIYSTDETQVGVWIDNKPLYQKTTYFGAISSGANYGLTMDIGANIVDTVIDMFANAKVSSGAWVVLPYPLPSANYAAYLDGYNKSTDKLTIKTGNDRSFVEGYATIYYTKTTDAAGSGGYQAYGFSPIIYSTEEREIGVWIDNKPLYQKTIDVGQLPDNNTKSVTIDGNIDLIISYDGFVYSTVDRTSQRPLPMVGNINDIRIDKVGTNLRLITYSEWSTYNGFVNITYTKTTDTAGSGSYNTLSVPTVHYSTDEQVIGTWIDGKPLYQKTIDTILSSNVTYIDTSALNIKRLIETIGQCDSNNGNNALFVPYYEDSTWRMYPQMDYTNQQLSIVTTATVLQYYSKLSITIKYTKTTD